MKKTETMKETKTFHAVHDQNGNIKSIFWTTSSAPAQQMMTPEKGCSVSQVNLREQLTVAQESKLTGGLEANQLRMLSKRYRVDTSTAGSLVKKSTISQK